MEVKENDKAGKELPHSAIRIFPSLHYVVSATDQSVNKRKEDERYWHEIFGINGLEDILPKKKYPFIEIVTIEGPRGTFKSTFGYNFLLKAVLEGKDGLLISLNDNPCLSTKFRLSKDIVIDNSDQFRQQEIITVSKDFSRNKLIFREVSYCERKIIEIAFKTGMLLPEEFIYEIEKVLSEYPDITHIVLDDVNAIDVSYPLLKSSKNASDLFLPCFVHLIRNRAKKLVVIGTTGQTKESDETVKKAMTLSDTVISCDIIDIFGEQHIIVTGEGLRTGGDDTITEPVPGVIKKIGGDKFEIDHAYLRGLIGFDTRNIRRPKVQLQLFEERVEAHESYNKEVKELLTSAIGQEGEVSLIRVYPEDSEAFHASIEILSEKPVDKTIVLTVDEFSSGWLSQPGKNFLNIYNLVDQESKPQYPEFQMNLFLDSFLGSVFRKAVDPQEETDNSEGKNKKTKELYFLPYYCNVLMLAFCNVAPNKEKISSWKDISSLLTADIKFIYDPGPRETLACTLLDALYAANIEQPGESNKKKFQGFIDSLLAKRNFKNECEELEANWKIFNHKSSEEQEDQRSSSISQVKVNPIEAYTKKIGILGNGKEFIFLGWYSQLCDLIESNPGIAKKITFCALPGRGFTGDWFIGIRKGSVSKNLGMDIIRALCKNSE